MAQASAGCWPAGGGAQLPLRLSSAAAAGAAAVTTTAPLGDVRWGVWAAVLAGGAVAELFATHIPGSQVFHTGTAFSVAAALVLPPELVVVVCVAQHVPEWLGQRYPWFVQTFNIANVVLSALAAWSMRAVFARNGVHVTAAATTSAVLAAFAAGLTFVLVNHAMLARMLRLARGHNVAASGLFTVDSLIQDGVVGAVGVDRPQDGASQLARHRSAGAQRVRTRAATRTAAVRASVRRRRAP